MEHCYVTRVTCDDWEYHRKTVYNFLYLHIAKCTQQVPACTITIYHRPARLHSSILRPLGHSLVMQTHMNSTELAVTVTTRGHRLPCIHILVVRQAISNCPHIHLRKNLAHKETEINTKSPICNVKCYYNIWVLKIWKYRENELHVYVEIKEVSLSINMKRQPSQTYIYIQIWNIHHTSTIVVNIR